MASTAAPGARGGHLYYGWILVATLGITETTSWGVLYYSFTVFLGPMHDTFHWSRSTMTGAFSLALLLSGFTGVLVGRWLDRHGPRVLMTAGSCAAVALLLAWAAVGNLLSFYLIWAAIGVTMAAVLYEPAFVVVATWFRRRRGRALTMLTVIAGLASVIYIPLSGWLIARQGWRGALVTLAIIVAVGTIPLHALVLRRRPEDLGLQPDGVAAPVEGTAGAPERSMPVRTALHGPTFWWLMGAFFLNSLGASALFVHLVPYLTDHGYGKEFAATIAGVVGIMALPGRVVLTPLGDRLPRSWVACAIFLLQFVALLVLLTVHSSAGVIGFVVLFGAGFGAVTPARAALTAEFYGPASYGAISGVLAFFLTGARALAPVGAGVLYDVTGGYSTVFWGLAVASLVGAVAVLVAERSAARMLRPATSASALPG
jgi:MFS family permease